MFSNRFQLPVVISGHAKIRMAERDVSEAMLLEVIDFGETRYKDVTHLWAFKEFPKRHAICYVQYWYWRIMLSLKQSCTISRFCRR